MTIFKNVVYLIFLIISHFLRKNKTIHYRLLMLQNKWPWKEHWKKKKKGIAYTLSFQRLHTIE